ncbi:MAG: tyrosine--tRNA ligase [Rickettsiales bacterium]|jgi:tyrosyl-tRNA synthetase|nr:tyrosine--tRNA ligase [Rickettsiales bacterium]
MTALPSFLSLFKQRGYLHQCTDESGLESLLASKPQPIYIGFDCTADSLHVGSLIQIMILRWLQKCGHKPIVLLGGGTTRVGDPSGKDEARQLLTPEIIERNKQGIRKIFERFLTFGNGPTDAILVDNADWLLGINYIDFLRDIGPHFSINRMLTFDSVRLRLEREQSLSFLEFNYMLLQAYDFTELYKRHQCRVQIGGSDQWGNIINGVELNRRLGGKELFGLTTPLLTTSSGAKMGKTASGAIWLNPDRLSPYDYWQFWRNTEDADVARFLRLFTELSLEEIEHLERLEGNAINDVKKRLATEATALCHGREAAEHAEETARKTFEQGGIGDDLPVLTIAKAELEAGIQAFMLFHRADLATSGGEARRLIRGGGAKINDAKIVEETQSITLADLDGEGIIKLSAGKKKHVLVKVG